MSDVTVEAALAATLDSLDGAHQYRDWIFALARPHLEAPVLEVGAGTGTFTALLAEMGAVTAVEPADALVAALRDRYEADARVSVVHGVIDDVDPGEGFAAAVMLNVLEHIPDDDAALRAIHRRLLPGAGLVVWVPAFPVLFSRFDRMLGHCRRYRLGPLRDLVTGAGFTVLDARYVNLPGWFAWLVIARLLGRVPTTAGAVSLYDRLVVPVVRAIESRWRPPFGQSVLVVARKPLDALPSG